MSKQLFFFGSLLALATLTGCSNKSIEGTWNVKSDSLHAFSDYTMTFVDGVMTSKATSEGVKVLIEERYRMSGSKLETPGAKVTVDASALEGEKRKLFESLSFEFKWDLEQAKKFTVKFKDSDHVTLTGEKQVIELERAK
ncbi:MAG: hypothetical protein R2688_02435 [Fimbriimonadaceae bacterium]